MKLDKLQNIPLYGDLSYRGDCPLEDSDLVSFVQWVVYNYPEYKNVITHIKNEGKRTPQQARRDKSMGLNRGFGDIVIASNPVFVCELKRKDHTKSTITDDQVEHLIDVIYHDGFGCIALGFDGAKKAFLDYLNSKGE